MTNDSTISPLKKVRSSYFGRIKNSIQSIMEGMSVTLGYLLQEPMTVQYPDKTEKPMLEMIPDRFRGILDVKIDICTACLACERACPIDCIKIEVAKDKETKKRFMNRFDIDISKCMFCGLCTENCPTNCITHSKEFEGSTTDVHFLVRRFVTAGPIEPYKVPKKPKPETPKPEPEKEKPAPEKAAPADGTTEGTESKAEE